MLTLIALETLIRESWGPDTVDPDDGWSDDNPSRGQCDVTCLVVNDLFGGELLSGEATRVPGNDRSGVASAYGSRGTFMNCEYKMTTPYQGTGTCHVSTGALYQVHIGA